MIDVINKAINKKIKSISFTEVINGLVEEINPLSIKINDRISIGLDFIEPKSLGISDNSPNPTLPFVIGDKVNLIRYNNGQRFYVLGVAGGGGGGTDNYNSLSNKPRLNTDHTDPLIINANEEIRGTIDLHKVAKTGSYNDLGNKPIIPPILEPDVDYLTPETAEETYEPIKGEDDNYLTNGDKGDITVNSQDDWSINDNAITTDKINSQAVSNNKLANMAANTIKGKSYMVGEPEDLSPSEVRDIINVEDGAEVNNIIEVDVLPTPDAAYLDKIYKVKDKLFTIKSAMSIVRRNILVGDNLSDKRVYCSYPDNFYLQIYEYSGDYGGIFINTTNGYYIFQGTNTIIDWEEMISHWCIEVNGWGGREYIYSWDTQTDSLYYNNEYTDSYKGIVTSIDVDNPAYQYMEIDGEEYSYEWKEYGGATELEKATGEEINEGTDDEKYVTPKAIEDSFLGDAIISSNNTVTDIMSLTQAEYEALPQTEKDNNTYFITDDLNGSMGNYVKGNANTNNIVSNIFIGTQAEYDALPNKTGILAIIEE